MPTVRGNHGTITGDHPHGAEEVLVLRPIPLLLSLAAALTALAGAVLVWPSGDLPGLTRDPAPEVTGLSFLDHAAGDEPREVDLLPPPGEVTVAYFGYLGCPDMCPLTMGDLRVAREQLGEDLAARTTVAFITVDPERDDGRRIRDYLGFFFEEGYLALRAHDDDSLAAAAERFGVRYELPEDADPDDHYEVAHTAITYVIDDTGTIVRELPFGAPPEDYTAVLRAALTDP